jgi:leader peptidase (prepilin peptidase)/N-methyltransferase
MLIKSPPEILSYLIGFNSTGQIIDLSVYSLFAFKVLFLILVAFFIVMFFADIKYYIIPDSMQFGAFLISLIIFIILNLDLSLWVYKLVSSILIACPLFLIFYFTKGRGMGFGDVKLGLLMGLILGAYSGFLALYCSFISGAVISLATLVLKKKSMKSHIPFGPFLIFGTFVIIFAENFVYDKIVMLFVF